MWLCVRISYYYLFIYYTLYTLLYIGGNRVSGSQPMRGVEISQDREK